MSLLHEYALTPDVFDLASYSGDEVGDLRLQGLKEALLNEGIVRNLRGGEWVRLFGDDGRTWHRRGKELIKKLIAQKRLRTCPACAAVSPTTDAHWCAEALASHTAQCLRGIIVTDRVAPAFAGNPLVGRVDRLSSVSWWAQRGSSLRLLRSKAAYEDNLRLILGCANSMLFVDPHLDPSRAGYANFAALLQLASGRTPLPLIEIHRVCYEGSGPSRTLVTPSEWESRFRSTLAVPLRASGLSADVFIWDQFHDRYLITDLIGISVPNGFDTTTNPNDTTTWTRLSRRDRDDIQREHDPPCNRHTLRHRFRVA